MVLPITSKVNSKGNLEIGGVDTVKLAANYKTPLYVIDKATVLNSIEDYHRAFKKTRLDYELIYAGKAFLCKGFCKILKQNDFSLDVSSGGELYTAIKAGFNPRRIYMHGNNKTLDELGLALRWGVGNIVVDNRAELRMLSKLRKKVSIFIRITPGISAYTHKYIETGKEDSKFGFALGSEALKYVKEALASPNINLKGFHVHIGSQIFTVKSFSRAIEKLMKFSASVYKKTGWQVGELNLGGGLGIKYLSKDKPASIEEYVKTLADQVKKQSKLYKMKINKVLIEPGRSIIGNAGVSLYTVGTVKKIPGVRTYVSVDGGMSDNLRPMLYGARYEALIANKADQKNRKRVTIAGKHCESGDVLIKDVALPNIEEKDILCIAATGAYGYSMANNYNRQPRPAVVIINKGRSNVLIRRETYQDIVRLDI
ncbi:MAG: diaminopimelate decarboxylase [Actinobacteria bacterium]|nr:MAG: diaminopimelate decarboxylase [Actinomycetota bacterium]